MGNISADKTKDKRSCAVKFIHDFVVGHDLDRITHVTASDSGKSRTSKRRKRDLLQQRIEHNIVFIPFSVSYDYSAADVLQHNTRQTSPYRHKRVSITMYEHYRECFTTIYIIVESRVRSFVDKVTLGQVFSECVGLSPVSTVSQLLHSHSFIHHSPTTYAINLQ